MSKTSFAVRSLQTFIFKLGCPLLLVHLHDLDQSGLSLILQNPNIVGEIAAQLLKIIETPCLRLSAIRHDLDLVNTIYEADSWQACEEAAEELSGLPFEVQWSSLSRS